MLTFAIPFGNESKFINSSECKAHERAFPQQAPACEDKATE